MSALFSTLLVATFAGFHRSRLTSARRISRYQLAAIE
jgi:hypothetical protein